MRNRAVHKTYAKAHHYFWKPCDLCGQEFGGHEWYDRDGKSSVFWYVKPDGSVSGFGICPECTQAGQGNSPQFPAPPRVSVTGGLPVGMGAGFCGVCGENAVYVTVGGCLQNEHVITRYLCREHYLLTLIAKEAGCLYCPECHGDGSPWARLTLLSDLIVQPYGRRWENHDT